MQQIENVVLDYIRKSTLYKAYSASPLSLFNADSIFGYPLVELIKAVSDKRGGRTIVITSTEDEAKRISESFPQLGYPIIYIPSDGRAFYSEYIEKSINFKRKKAQEKFLSSKRALVIMSLRSFSSPFLSFSSLSSFSYTLKCGEDLDVDAFSKTLVSGGYYRSDNISEEGTFNLRGEIIEIYPFALDRRYRIFLDWEKIDRIISLPLSGEEKPESIRSVSISFSQDEKIENLETVPFTDFVNSEDYFILNSYENSEGSFKAFEREVKERYKDAYKEGKDLVKSEDYLIDFASFHSSLSKGIVIHDIMKADYHHFSVEPSHSYFGNVTFFKDEAKAMINSRWRIYILSPSVVQQTRLDNIFSSLNVDISVSNIDSGFMLPQIKVAVILDSEIFGRRKRRIKTVSETLSSPLDSFVSLKKGDYVVHVNYGIGQFEKIDRVKSGETERDYIKIRYDKGETLYVPIEQTNLVQKYIGNDSKPPKLDTMSSQNWAKKKEKARENAEKLALDLLHLYAVREHTPGYPFSPDTDWQVAFEASFPYTETPDQIKCIEEIKADMESTKCMDRLVCGDVGYGKTEIAFRAAFKAIMSGKQVAFLAPTVILAEQHYNNFKKRVSDFPVVCGLSTRFVSSKDNREVLKSLREGKVDILFGTHKILSENVVFKDLGLLIVDEEQRFGVKDKEKIKSLRSNIDSLTLSATPIPRTLYMSLLKVRDMSLLSTAPRERLPIDTFIGEYDIEKVKIAILKELERGGQVFYLHNKVEDIEEVASTLRALIPHAIVDTAHGQMDAERLEEVMHRFIYEGVQVLVSTTVIENGIDIPNVNTIIVDRAERMGLGQLYQLRGRVGRSDRKAYCYLFYPDGSCLNQDAIKRLKVLSENTSLGSGFKVSMSDMEIRGTGNILGREQSGQLEAVGLDMYLKLIEEEIERLKSSDGIPEKEVLVQLDYTGFIPDNYISDPSAKFELYKKIASVKSEDELFSLRNEVERRYGEIRLEVDNLFYIAEIKIVARKLKISSLKEYKGKICVVFDEVSILNPTKVVELITLSAGRVKLDPKAFNHLYIETDTVSLKDKAVLILETLRRLM